METARVRLNPSLFGETVVNIGGVLTRCIKIKTYPRRKDWYVKQQRDAFAQGVRDYMGSMEAGHVVTK